MVLKHNIRGDRRQVSFYPEEELVNRIDKLALDEGGFSRSAILEMIILDWFDRVKNELKDSSTANPSSDIPSEPQEQSML